MRNVFLMVLGPFLALFFVLSLPQRLASQDASTKKPDAKATTQPVKGAAKKVIPAPTQPACAIKPIYLKSQTDSATVAKLLMRMFPDFTVSPDPAQSSKLYVVDKIAAVQHEEECKSKSWKTTLSTKKLEDATALLDHENFKGVTFDPAYLIFLPNLNAADAAQNLPYPAASLRLMQASDEYLLPIPVQGGQADAPSDQALKEQAAKIKHDLEALDDQYAVLKDGKDAADLLSKVKGAGDVAEAARATWMSHHTIEFSTLEPRDVILAFQTRFGGHPVKSKFVPLLAQHAVVILPQDASPSDGVWLSAMALQRNILIGGAGAGTQVKNDSVAAGATTSTGQARVVRLYHLREAGKIAAALNTNTGSDHPLVAALDEDQLVILPAASGQAEEIRHAIAMLDLPRPQVSLQVWSYQISSKPRKDEKNGSENESRSASEIQDGFEAFRKKVATTNEFLTKALADGMGALEARARTPEYGYFDPTFREYLTSPYSDCVTDDHYCLGYTTALQVPALTPEKPENYSASANPSLARFLLLLAAAADGDQIGNAIGALQARMKHDAEGLKFERFFKQLNFLSTPANLRTTRAAVLDFFFQYKLATNYPNSLSPYGLQEATHTLDNILSPVMDAFDQDVDEYIEGALKPLSADKKTLSTSFGEVQVTTISGTQAQVTGKVKNYFDVTEPPTLADVLSNVSSASSTGGLGAALQNVLAPKEIALAQFIANANTQPKVYAQVGKDTTLTITPTSLDGASAAELSLDFDVADETDSATTVNQSAAKTDLLDRVSEHHVKDQVRVESLKLFQISAFTMQLTHKSQPKCWSYSPFCVVWKAVFGSVPGLDNLFEITPRPETKDNKSAAVVRAVVVPTAMDLGLSVRYERDRINDAATHTAIPARSVSQINGDIFQFHRELMRCIVTAGACLDKKNEKLKLSKLPEDAPRQ